MLGTLAQLCAQSPDQPIAAARLLTQVDRSLRAGADQAIEHALSTTVGSAHDALVLAVEHSIQIIQGPRVACCFLIIGDAPADLEWELAVAAGMGAEAQLASCQPPPEKLSDCYWWTRQILASPEHSIGPVLVCHVVASNLPQMLLAYDAVAECVQAIVGRPVCSLYNARHINVQD